jgi:hypothetical protein
MIRRRAVKCFLASSLRAPDMHEVKIAHYVDTLSYDLLYIFSKSLYLLFQRLLWILQVFQLISPNFSSDFYPLPIMPTSFYSVIDSLSNDPPLPSYRSILCPLSLSSFYPFLFTLLLILIKFRYCGFFPMHLTNIYLILLSSSRSIYWSSSQIFNSYGFFQFLATCQSPAASQSLILLLLIA